MTPVHDNMVKIYSFFVLFLQTEPWYGGSTEYVSDNEMFATPITDSTAQVMHTTLTGH